VGVCTSVDLGLVEQWSFGHKRGGAKRESLEVPLRDARSGGRGVSI